MLLDASIPARHPAAVAGFIAELWGTEAVPAPPVPGRFVALAGDGSGAGIEVHPLGIGPVRSWNGTTAGPAPTSAATVTRLVIGAALDESEVHLAAGVRGWQSRPAIRRAEGHAWRVIEVWVEERLLVEVLTPEMQAEFRAARAGLAPGATEARPVLMVAA
ncbi:hypothetical protein [Elioraea tepidiphila]|jgi:hypothetical protein|uniref:hypothetical protein n=1 Tax=Elioraea tepidiphila TaxID=457934 RepID=UPI000378DF96|nr:hypothetical protein [Elioraea tepidiphila]